MKRQEAEAWSSNIYLQFSKEHHEVFETEKQNELVKGSELAACTQSEG